MNSKSYQPEIGDLHFNGMHWVNLKGKDCGLICEIVKKYDFLEYRIYFIQSQRFLTLTRTELFLRGGYCVNKKGRIIK